MRIDKFTTKFQQALADAQSIAVGTIIRYIEPLAPAARLAAAGRRQRPRRCCSAPASTFRR